MDLKQINSIIKNLKRTRKSLTPSPFWNTTEEQEIVQRIWNLLVQADQEFVNLKVLRGSTGGRITHWFEEQRAFFRYRQLLARETKLTLYLSTTVLGFNSRRIHRMIFEDHEQTLRWLARTENPEFFQIAGLQEQLRARNLPFQVDKVNRSNLDRSQPRGGKAEDIRIDLSYPQTIGNDPEQLGVHLTALTEELTRYLQNLRIRFEA